MMPIFEYTCDGCGKRFSALVGVLASSRPPVCPRCSGSALTKLVSRFARVRSEDETIESLTDESKYGDIDNDPQAMRRWVRDMSKAMDEDMEGDMEEALEDELSGGATAEAVDDTIY